MKALNLVVGASLAVVATAAFAGAGVNQSKIDNVTNIDGRADVLTVNTAGPVVARPANEVAAGPATGEGPSPEAIQAIVVDVNKVSGRS